MNWNDASWLLIKMISLLISLLLYHFSIAFDYDNLHGTPVEDNITDLHPNDMLPVESVIKSFQITQRKMDKQLFHGIGESSR